jgi:hypothetical protein
MTDDPDLAQAEALLALPSESLKAHTAFLDYVRMGSGRSLRKLCMWYEDGRQIDGETTAVPTVNLRSLEKWSVKFDWQKRLDAYQKDLDRQDQQLWEKRRHHIRETDWDVCEQLRVLVTQALAQMPQFLKTTRQYVKGRNGDPDREVITVQQDLMALLKAVEVTSKLQRLAAGMPDSHTEISGSTVTASDLAAVRAEMERWERDFLDGANTASGSGTGA